jgi:hypothetical protein
MKFDYQPLTKKQFDELAPQIESWKEQHREVRALSVELDDGKTFEGIFRCPTQADLKLAMRKELSEMDSNKELCRMTVLYPEPVTFNTVMTDYWGISIPLAKKLLEWSNVTKEASIKKL